MDGRELLRLMPPVLRARDFRLYTQEGRLVDLWQDGGRAILGHKPPQLLRELKNSAERGLFAGFPHPQEGRFLKALSRLLPGRRFRFYSGRASLNRALEAAGFPCPGPGPGSFPDPAFPAAGETSSGISLWRPFLENLAEPVLRETPVLIPALPWPLSPQAAAFRPDWEDRFPPSDIVSPVILSAAARGIYDLIAAGNRGKPVYPKINRLLYGQHGQKPCPWYRRGVYLTLADAALTEAGINWETLFRRFLEGGFLIPPGPGEPLILPGILSPGEEAKLALLLGESLKGQNPDSSEIADCIEN
ncbi:MAG: hypothetical protein LBH26_03100 [Treponema sp.]|jgi:hypothetical protein|nr:hypothetical protein [Treponema sp.]